ncbi:hypothetical protein PVAND_006353 [Polypedilum vanderplanki]|uniref:Leucine-rich repeat protein n=1 Tax=Polypedilum vanderplanki TaxID=319348 RepID=A0A9J6C3P6_POLVA|nr:hypothetical protein PVAND_006353 [Polypedilum vanderplanki]
MLIFNKNIFVFCFLVTSFSFCNTTILKCTFDYDLLWAMFHRRPNYTCVINDGDIFGDFCVNITDVTGQHYENNTNDDVKGIVSRRVRKLNYIPRNIEKFFKNIIAMDLSFSNIQAISQDDFKSFPNLEVLNLLENHITEILEDTFKYNLKLEIIILMDNDIYYIGSTTFNHLENLEILELTDNICISTYAMSKEEVLNITKMIQESECVDKKIRTINAKISSNTNKINMVTNNVEQKLNRIAMENDQNIKSHVEKFDEKFKSNTFKMQNKTNETHNNENFIVTKYLWIAFIVLCVIVFFLILLVVKVFRNLKRIKIREKDIERKLEEIKRKSIFEMREDLGHFYEEIQNQESQTQF